MSTRRALLVAAAGGAIAVGSGLSSRRAGAQPVADAAALVARGVDYSWGRPRPSAVRAAGYAFACRYLSYDTTGKNLSHAEADALIAAGVDVVANWETVADEALQGYSRGAQSARDAQSQAVACGMPPDRPIYFSVDFDATPGQQSTINAYFDGVASVLGRVRTGAYGGYYPIQRLFDAGKIAWGWQTYAWSGGQWDSRAHLRQVRNGVKVDGADVDLDEAWAADFGQWGHGGGQPQPRTGKVYDNVRSPSGTWSGAHLVDASGSVSQIAAAGTPNGEAHLLTLTGGNVYLNRRAPSGAWSGVSLVDGGGGVFGVVAANLADGSIQIDTLA